jgi:hypothetical protein
MAIKALLLRRLLLLLLWFASCHEMCFFAVDVPYLKEEGSPYFGGYALVRNCVTPAPLPPPPWARERPVRSC